MSKAYTETRRAFVARPHKQQIKLAMKFQRLSGRELAMRAQVSPSTITNVLGRRATCNPETAGKIAHALNLDTGDLFSLEQVDYAA